MYSKRLYQSYKIGKIKFFKCGLVFFPIKRYYLTIKISILKRIRAMTVVYAHLRRAMNVAQVNMRYYLSVCKIYAV